MKLCASLLFSILAWTCISAQIPHGLAHHYNVSHSLALKGYDVLAYHTMHKAIKGYTAYQCTYEHVTYLFSDATNKALFLQNPQKYMPQYGGWCAYAMGAKGSKVDIDPTTFKIVDGKLYLFYNALFNNTLEEWDKNEKILKINADNNWQKILKN